VGTNECGTSSDCLASYTVSGTIYLGSATWNGTSYTGRSGAAVFPGAGSTVMSTRLPVGTVQADGTWSIGGVPMRTKVFTLTPMDSVYSTLCLHHAQREEAI